MYIYTAIIKLMVKIISNFCEPQSSLYTSLAGFHNQFSVLLFPPLSVSPHPHPPIIIIIIIIIIITIIVVYIICLLNLVYLFEYDVLFFNCTKLYVVTGSDACFHHSTGFCNYHYFVCMEILYKEKKNEYFTLKFSQNSSNNEKSCALGIFKVIT